MTTTFYINEGKTEKFRIILHNYTSFCASAAFKRSALFPAAVAVWASPFFFAPFSFLPQRGFPRDGFGCAPVGVGFVGEGLFFAAFGCLPQGGFTGDGFGCFRVEGGAFGIFSRLDREGGFFFLQGELHRRALIGGLFLNVGFEIVAKDACQFNGGD